MAPKYRLTYFDFTGLAEPIRFLLSYGGLDFEDHRVSKDDWPAFKLTTPLGQMPLLEFEGKVLYQSTAIARYLGHIVGLAGESPLENWEIDSVVDSLTDLRNKVFEYQFEQDEDRKKALRKSFVNEMLPLYYSKFELWALRNGGYLANGKLTWADLYFVAVQEFINLLVGIDLIADKYPNLETVREKVLSLPQIKAWLEKRPELKL
nr:GSTs2 [Pagiophloeus tsushimanus]